MVAFHELEAGLFGRLVVFSANEGCVALLVPLGRKLWRKAQVIW